LKVVTWGAVGVELRKAAAATDSHLAQHLIDQFIGLLKHLHLMPMQVRSGLSEELRAHREWASANRDKPSVFRSRVSSVDRLKTMEHTERLRNLLLQMDSMLTRAPAVERHRFDSSPYSREPWIGFSVNDMAYFFYVPLNQPETLLLKRFRTSIDPGAFDRSLGDLVPAPKGQMRWVARLDLLAPSPSFFDLDEDDQENRLGAFFDQAFAYAEGLQVSPGN
jgi:hypothetical protein